MRIAVLTSSTAREMIEEVVGELSDVLVVALPVHAIGMLRTSTIARILERRREIAEALRDADIVLVPGSVEGDTRVIEEVVGRPVYKATRSPVLLPAVINHLRSGGSLSRTEPAEAVIPGTRLSAKLDFEEAFSIGGVKVPLRGPPMVLVSEVPPYRGIDEARREAQRYSGDGADIIAVGCALDEEPGMLARRVEAALSAGKPVLAEAPSRAHAKAALEAGASGVIAAAGDALEYADLIGAGHVVVVGSRSLGELRSTVEDLRGMGVSKVIADPSLQAPPLGFLESIRRLVEASSRIEVPIQFTAANVVDEVEADTHSIHGLLALVAAEARASVYYVVEDSYKAYRSTAEAREAIDLALAAWTLKRSRDLYSRLLVVKQPHPPPKPPKVKAERVGYVEPIMDKRGYITIHVDHERGVIVAVYKLYKGGMIAFEGTHPTSIARALVRAVKLDPEHAAYLGYELAKAEIALRLGRSYIQDEPVITPVWSDGWGLYGSCSSERPGEGNPGGGALRSQGERGYSGCDREKG